MIFASELDNTLLYEKGFLDCTSPCEVVQYYLNQPKSFAPLNTFVTLGNLRQQVNFISVTSRSKEQMDRIFLSHM